MTPQHTFVPASIAALLFPFLTPGADARQSAGALAPDVPDSLRDAAFASALRLVQDAESGDWLAPGGPRGMCGRFDGNQVRLEGGDEARGRWSLGFELESWGRAGALVAASPAEPTAEGNGIEFHRGALTEWYVNDARGLEQGFTVESSPCGEGPLQLSLALERGWVAEILPGERDARLRDPHGAAGLLYSGLRAWDATQRDLGASLAFEDGRLTIRVEDAHAAYPVQIDPWFEEEKLISSDAASGDRIGFSVAIDGDTAVVGARNDTHSSVSLAGSAYVFVRSGPVWRYLSGQVHLVDGGVGEDDRPHDGREEIGGSGGALAGVDRGAGAQRRAHRGVRGASWVERGDAVLVAQPGAAR